MGALDAVVKSLDIEGEVSVREYMKLLLTTLWKEADGFSGKRPFGNSGWKYDVYAALIRNGDVWGVLDEYGLVEDVDVRNADAVIYTAINEIFGAGGQEGEHEL